VSIIDNVRIRKEKTDWPILVQIYSDIVDSIEALSKIRNQYFDRKSYSQYGEDKVLRALLPEKFGTYLDIGSGHPKRNSNTFWFYRRGWRGVLVEPLPSLNRIASKVRPRDKHFQCMIGEKGTQSFWEFNPSEYSTSDFEQAQKCIVRNVQLLQRYSIPSNPLGEIAPSMVPSEPTFMDIDVEGTDVEVLKSNDWSRTKPRVVLVEDRNVFSDDESEVASFLTAQGYILISVVVQSCIYVHSSYDLGWDV
jgi:FkbM family methyltransferase